MHIMRIMHRCSHISFRHTTVSFVPANGALTDGHLSVAPDTNEKSLRASKEERVDFSLQWANPLCPRSLSVACKPFLIITPHSKKCTVHVSVARYVAYTMCAHDSSALRTTALYDSKQLRVTLRSSNSSRRLHLAPSSY